MRKMFFLLVSFGVLSAETLINEPFKTLDAWQSVKFEKIDKLSTYRSTPSGLLLESNNSASALRLKGAYDVEAFPKLSFEWQTTVCHIDGDAKSKSGDDAPIRLYVAWEYTPETANWFEALVYETLKLFYGEYPPKAVLNYVVTSKALNDAHFNSPYTDKVKIIPLDSCEKNLGEVKRHTVNIIEDYRRFFGQMPQGKATLGVMADSDNTHGKTSAIISYIRLESDEAKH